MSGHCKDCVWWEIDQEAEVLWADILPKGWHYCRMTISASDEPEQPTTLAFALDHESYKAELLTAPAFGCIQFEQRE